MKTVFYSLLFAITLCLLPCSSVFAASTTTPNTQVRPTAKENTGYFNKSINQVSTNLNLNSTLNRTTFASPKGIKMTHSRTNKGYSWNQSSSINTESYLHTQKSGMMQSPTLSSFGNTSMPTGSMSTGPVTKSTAFQTQSFSSFSSSEPFSNNSTSIGTFSGPQYVAICDPISSDYSPTTNGPLNHSTLALFSLLGLFFIYKKITEF